MKIFCLFEFLFRFLIIRSRHLTLEGMRLYVVRGLVTGYYGLHPREYATDQSPCHCYPTIDGSLRFPTVRKGFLGMALAPHTLPTQLKP